MNLAKRMLSRRLDAVVEVTIANTPNIKKGTDLLMYAKNKSVSFFLFKIWL